jgi:S-adenosylmethionine hydrolase
LAIIHVAAELKFAKSATEDLIVKMDNTKILAAKQDIAMFANEGNISVCQKNTKFFVQKKKEKKKKDVKNVAFIDQFANFFKNVIIRTMKKKEDVKNVAFIDQFANFFKNVIIRTMKKKEKKERCEKCGSDRLVCELFQKCK